jgi:ABC-type multidrug transport system fused ATPase/permease subunit
VSADAAPGDGERTGAPSILHVIAQTARFVQPFSGRFGVKAGLILVSLLPSLLLPWPIKLMVDNVIEGMPLDEPLRPYPAFIAPFIGLLEGRSPEAMLAILVAAQVVLFALVGAFGTAGGERDSAEAHLASGHDTATRTEGEANSGWSFAGGLLGLFDFRYTIRLSQAMNHHYRSRLFERVQHLPVTAFADERIGDAVYRVMYDTPAITNAAYRILLTPVTAPVFILLTTWVIWVTYGPMPHLLLASLAMVPAACLGRLPCLVAFRRGSRDSGG